MDQHLLTFVTVCEKKNFTRAAESLHLTQSAVSLEIKNLEAKYGVKLLDRTNKYVRLTKAGEILYFHAKEIVNLHEKAQRLIEDLSFTSSGPLVIGSSYTFGEYALPRIIANFVNEYPKVTPSINIRNTKRVIDQVLQREIDVGIIEGTAEHPDLTIHPFAQDEMVVIVPHNHRLSQYKEIDAAKLASETWILREKGSGTREMTDRILSTIGLSPESVMEFGSSQIIKESVESGLGISAISEWAIRKEVTYGTLIPLRIKDQSFKRNMYYVTHASQFQTKATELFIDFLCSNAVPIIGG